METTMQDRPTVPTEVATAANDVLNRACEADGDPITLARILCWVGTQLVYKFGNAGDFIVHAERLREAADGLERKVTRQ
jgi:hypothetical protein